MCYNVTHIVSETGQDAKVCGEGDGEYVRGRAQVLYQPAHGQPREPACHQGEQRVPLLTEEHQAIQQVSI